MKVNVTVGFFGPNLERFEERQLEGTQLRDIVGKAAKLSRAKFTEEITEIQFTIEKEKRR